MTVGDTAAISLGIGGSPAVSVIAGGSALLAGLAVRAKSLRSRPPRRLTCREARSTSRRRGPARAATDRSSVGEIARLGAGHAGHLVAAGRSPGLERTALPHTAQASSCNGTQVVEVEVDIDDRPRARCTTTSAPTTAARIINPMLVDGQVRGGVAHGIGNALFEWMGYDENAQPLTTNYERVSAAHRARLPDAAIGHIGIPAPLNPLGVKGAGEGGTSRRPPGSSPPSMTRWPFGVRFTEMPLTPDRIVAALQGRRRFRSSLVPAA